MKMHFAWSRVVFLVLLAAKTFAAEPDLKLEANYAVTLRETKGHAPVRIAEVEVYIENAGAQDVRVLSMSREFEVRSSNGYFVYSAGIGKRKDGKVIKPPETAFNPVQLLPGEVARLPALRVVLEPKEESLVNFSIYYRISSEAGAALGVWSGELECKATRRDPVANSEPQAAKKNLSKPDCLGH